MDIQYDNGVLYANFPGFGERTAFGPPPRGWHTPTAKIVEGALNALGDYEETLAAAQQGQALTPRGIAEHTEPSRARARRMVDNSFEAFAAHRPRVQRQIDALLAVPLLDPTDAVAAMNEATDVARFPRLTEVQRNALATEMTAGRRDSVLLALARSDARVPSTESAWAKSVWQERAEKEHADQLVDLRAQLKELEWAESVPTRMILDRGDAKMKAQMPVAPREALDLTYGAKPRPTFDGTLR